MSRRLDTVEMTIPDLLEFGQLMKKLISFVLILVWDGALPFPSLVSLSSLSKMTCSWFAIY